MVWRGVTMVPASPGTRSLAIRRFAPSSWATRASLDRETATAHGFRAMARTMAAERLGIDLQVIEVQLAHAVGDALGRA